MGQPVTRGLQFKRQGGELRPKPVMQIATQSAALLFTRRDQPLARVLEVGGETDGVCGDPCLASQIVEQLPLQWAEGLARSAWSEQ